jgi:hypothetical protein
LIGSGPILVGLGAFLLLLKAGMGVRERQSFGGPGRVERPLGGYLTPLLGIGFIVLGISELVSD